MRFRSDPAPCIYLHTLGCPKNEADSRNVARCLTAAGAVVTRDPAQATHILVNTCGFIQEAKEESIRAILDACGAYPGKRVLVMGCLVERYRRDLEKGIPEVAGWFGLADDAVRVPNSAADGVALWHGKGEHGLLEALGLRGDAQDAPRTYSLAAPYAYLKISDGCDEMCTFCAIPAIKGRYRSASTASILSEADACLQEGARELVLVGQDTAIWECDGLDLCGLIDLLAADARVCRLRVMYLQPEHITDDLLGYMATQPKLCRYLDVPFQHAHPEILRRMGRGGNAEAFLSLLERARRLMPDVSVRSAFIVAFPGETDEHFDRLMRFVDEAEFDHAGGFVYSPEEQTPAAALRPRVPARVARDRLNRLTEMLTIRAEGGHQRLVGDQVRVMIDTLDDEDTGEGMIAVGRTEGQAPEVDGVTYVEGGLPEGTAPGDVVLLRVRAALGYDLIGTCDAS